MSRSKPPKIFCVPILLIIQYIFLDQVVELTSNSVTLRWAPAESHHVTPTVHNGGIPHHQDSPLSHQHPRYHQHDSLRADQSSAKFWSSSSRGSNSDIEEDITRKNLGAKAVLTYIVRYQLSGTNEVMVSSSSDLL